MLRRLAFLPVRATGGPNSQIAGVRSFQKGQGRGGGGRGGDGRGGDREDKKGGFRPRRDQAGRNPPSQSPPDFIQDSVRSRGGEDGGRGSGSYTRFLMAHKKTVLEQEGKRYESWSQWKGKPADTEGQWGPVEMSEEELSYEAQALGLGDEEGVGRRGRGGDDLRDDLVGSYFDWNSEDIFIPRLPEKDARGRPTSDVINVEDNTQIRLGKLLWRKMKIMAADMDRHVPSWRRYQQRRSKGGDVQPTAAFASVGGAVQDQESKGAVELERETLLEVARLNSAQSLDDIERQINRVLVEANMDNEWLQELYKADEDAAKTDEELDDEMDAEDLEHYRDLKEALSDIPTTDPDTESFEHFRAIADQLIQAGGVVTYTYTGADIYKREVSLPLPLATPKTFSRSIAIDSKHKAAKSDDFIAQAWKSLAKTPNIGEQKRLELTRQLARTINKLSKPGMLDKSAYLTDFK